MKKLLAAAFILSSIAVLAKGSEGGHGGSQGPQNCYTSACETSANFEVKVKIPEQIRITRVDDIDLGTWCGTVPVSNTGTFKVEGASGKRIETTVYGLDGNNQYAGVLKFKKDREKHGGGSVQFDGNIYFENNSSSNQYDLSNPNPRHSESKKGEASGTITAHLNPINGSKSVELAGENLVAQAKLVAKYVDVSW